MTRPPTKTMLLGHPLICLPIYALGALLLYAWATQQTVEAGALGIMALILLGATNRANTQRAAYLRWKRAWDGMAEDAPQQRANKRAHRIGLAIGGAIVVAVLLASANPDAPLTKALPGLFLLGGILFFAGLWLRRVVGLLRRRRTTTATGAVVTVCARPLMPVPTLIQAYAALPPHCQQLLQQRATDASPARH